MMFLVRCSDRVGDIGAILQPPTNHTNYPMTMTSYHNNIWDFDAGFSPN